MAALQPISEAFVKLGTFLTQFCENEDRAEDLWSKKLNETIVKATQQNGWFTMPNILFSLKQWGSLLTKDKIEDWLSVYAIADNPKPKRIAIVMAGNIPLVGFHDFICVLLSGNNVLAKLSSNDAMLLPFLVEYLVDCNPDLSKKIAFTKEQFKDFDAVIATGSNNTGRYFEYYFGKYPNIIRKNRNSVGILTGGESKEDLTDLGEDIFRYFGLGCRSISKIFVPENYDFKDFFEAIFDYRHVLETTKYANNYDYNKAVYLMSEYKLLDNEFLLLKEDTGFASPIGTLYYEHYTDTNTLGKKLLQEKENIQCVVGNSDLKDAIPFGSTQNPSLSDYADGVDTLKFLIDL